MNVNAQSPANAFVLSEVIPTPVASFEIVYGDLLECDIYLVDGEGSFAPESGLSGYSVNVLVGLLGQGHLAKQDTWSLSSNGWTGSINLNTSGIRDLLAGAESVDIWIEVEVTDPSGNRRTYGQINAKCRNQTTTPEAAVPTPLAEYYTTVETNDRFIQNRSGISGLTGGGVTKLDGIATVSLTVNQIVAVTLSGVMSFYQLVSGTDAEDSPNVIRPDDYAGGTNEKVWVLRYDSRSPQRAGLGGGAPDPTEYPGRYDWDVFLDTDTGQRYNWNLPTNEWLP